MAVDTPRSRTRATPPATRVRLQIGGVVQGVGFRPFVYRLATDLGLAGFVGNDPDGVFAEVEGSPGAVEGFVDRLVGEAPPLARIDHVDRRPIPAQQCTGFRVVMSRHGGRPTAFVPPDVAVCDDCRRELAEPTDPRYRYPFITCTNCGPRFTIITRLPYDRPFTTMDRFALCDRCASQYHDPADRRFHAQPLACEACGPRIWWESGGRRIDGTDAALAAAHAALARGLTVAVKGVGGYHLACDPGVPGAVERLRERKRRGPKPFAVMVRDLVAASRIAVLTDGDRRLLEDPARPIVLLRAADRDLAGRVAPGSSLLGLLLPYTPLHHLLLQPVPEVPAAPPDQLVMTSGNLSDEPICFDDADARSRLDQLADAWLVHDRPIHLPCDDSVVRADGAGAVPIRRSRGYAPLPLRLPFAVPPALAVGGQLKNTFCLGRDRVAWMSQHIGDMGGVETLAAFATAIRHFAEMYGIEPIVVACDAHPGYHTTGWAERHAGPARLCPVQHHHAHVAALMAEHEFGREDAIIGIAFDGTGYGPGGAIWGGEILLSRYDRFERIDHLRPVRMPGGDATIRAPHRTALAFLDAAGIDWAEDLGAVSVTSAEQRAVLRRQLDRDVNCVAASSVGRLFDAVSSLLGVRHHAAYEAQAAIELEAVARDAAPQPGRYRFERTDDGFDPAPLLAAIVDDLRAGRSTAQIAADFHLALAEQAVRSAQACRVSTGVAVVGLTGGVFQNTLLLELTRDRLTECGFTVVTHRRVPPNDGGLALGQLVVAAAQLDEGTP